jgi:PAS domain S-box-containing protein
MFDVSRIFGKAVNSEHAIDLLLIISMLVMSLCIGAWVQTPQPRIIRVGVYENAPKIYTDKDGTVSGFWPALLEDIAKQENWQIEWVPGTWDECLKRLENGEIDMMPDVGFTEERAELYTFSDEAVITSWARIYAPSGSSIETIIDLDGKSIAGLSGSLNFDGPEGIKVLTSKFGVNCTFVALDSYTAVFEALQNKQVDAGITNKDFGNSYEGNYEIKRTPIIIQPSQIRFAFPKNANLTSYLVERINLHINLYKSNSNSIYYQALEQYLGESQLQGQMKIPQWVYLLLGIAVISIFFLLTVNMTTRAIVKTQTAELRTSENRMRALVENLPDLMVRMNWEGNILDIQSGAESTVPIVQAELFGKNITHIFPSPLAKAYQTMISAALASRRIQLSEYQWMVNGQARDYEARFNASGMDEVIVIVRDITERKQSEKELRESKERYQTLANVAPVGIFHTDKDGCTTYVNPTWCRISGLTAEQGLGYGWLDAVHVEDRQSLENGWNLSTQKKNASFTDYRFVHQDGSIVWVAGQAVPEVNSDHEIIGYVGTITDITERKENETALQRAMSAERAALDVAHTIQAANLSLSNNLNLDEVLQVLLDHLALLVPYDQACVMLLEPENTMQIHIMRGKQAEDKPVHKGYARIGIDDFPCFKQVIKNKHGMVVVDIDQCPDWKCFLGESDSGSWIGIPLIAGGEVLGLYTLDNKSIGSYGEKERELAETISAQAAIAIKNASLHEELKRYAAELELRVNERTNELQKRVFEVESYNLAMHQLMEELTEALKKAESADRLKSAFLATMSHELRTPLNSIIGFTGILLQQLVGPLSEEQDKQLRMVQGSAHHLLELINDVLDISKIEAGQVDIRLDWFDMQVAIQKSVEKVLPLANKKGIDLSWSKNGGPLKLLSDQRRVEQILINLLNNAIKFTEAGYVLLECEINGMDLHIRVKDTGIGIAPNELQNLFLPFRQVDSGLTRKYEGTGLGLSICKRLVELLGGKIWVTSESGQGSTFEFTLPYPEKKI